MSTGFVSRSNWGARSAKAAPTRLVNPKGVCYHYEGVDVPWEEHSRCPKRVQNIQYNHMFTDQIAKGGGNDIAYNLLICQHGYIFEGRGVNVRSGANGTNEGNGGYYAICFLIGPGNDFNDTMKTAGIDARQYLIDKGDAGGQIKKHSDFIKTSCPGSPVVSWINLGLPGGVTPSPTPNPPSNDWFEETIKMLPTLDFTNPTSLKGSGLVDNVQGLLNGTQNAACFCDIDNIAGPQTLKAVQSFQRMKGLKDDGIVGPITWRALITH